MQKVYEIYVHKVCKYVWQIYEYAWKIGYKIIIQLYLDWYEGKSTIRIIDITINYYYI